jgi:hypothetical protein
MFYAGWGTDTYGARNITRGEYDTCLYYTVTLGVPVYISFRGCVHVIEVGKIPPAQRDRLRSFLIAHFGWSEAKARYLPASVSLPLRPLRSLKWMGRLNSLLWVLGIVAALGLLATLAISQQPVEPFRKENVLFLSPFWVAGAIFLPLLVAYLVLREPSPRQAGIREVVADQLGAFSDPADWPQQVAVPVAAAYGAEETPEAALDAAEQHFSHGNAAVGMILARLALALPEGRADAGMVRDADALADECLRKLEGDLR